MFSVKIWSKPNWHIFDYTILYVSYQNSKFKKYDFKSWKNED